MGYTTEFSGSFTSNVVMDDAFVSYINQFALARHMKRDIAKIKEIYPEWESQGFFGNLGSEGQFFIGDDGWDIKRDPCMNRPEADCSILDYNRPAEGVPGLWCDWVIAEDKKTVEWDGSEKFYHYVDWICYLITNFFVPAGYVLNGIVKWQGEDMDDRGEIHIDNNEVTVEHLK